MRALHAAPTELARFFEDGAIDIPRLRRWRAVRLEDLGREITGAIGCQRRWEALRLC